MSTNHNLFEEKETREAESSQGPSAYQPNAYRWAKPAHASSPDVRLFSNARRLETTDGEPAVRPAASVNRPPLSLFLKDKSKVRGDF